jgi:hypothetical protein
MEMLAIILGLCLSGGPSQDGPRPDATGPRGVENFCGVMKDPKLFLDKPVTLEATAQILYGGELLNSDECRAPDVSVHYMRGYEKGSNAEAFELLRRFRREVHAAHLRGADIKAEQIKVSVVLEGRLGKNPHYLKKWDRGPATVAAWDYNDEYAFVVTRVVSLRRL